MLTMEHKDARHDAVDTDVVMGARDRYTDKASMVRADVSAGSLIAFDIRLLHRGLSNPSVTERSVLYFTFAKSWFEDQHMFQKTERV